jgi:chromosome partitioning protein
LKIISLINSKGGVGKTTLAINLARYVQLYKSKNVENDKATKVLLVDADTQGSMRDWHDAGGSAFLNMTVADKKSAILQIPEILKKSEYDYVFIDTPGTLNEIIGAAISISDLVLIPLQPSPFDVWASKDIVEIISTRHAVLSTQSPKTFYVLNGCIKGTKAEKEVMEYLNKSTIVPLYQCIHQRIDYAVSVSSAITIFETSNKLAIEEMAVLGSLLLKELGE